MNAEEEEVFQLDTAGKKRERERKKRQTRKEEENMTKMEREKRLHTHGSLWEADLPLVRDPQSTYSCVVANVSSDEYYALQESHFANRNPLIWVVPLLENNAPTELREPIMVSTSDGPMELRCVDCARLVSICTSRITSETRVGVLPENDLVQLQDELLRRVDQFPGRKSHFLSFFGIADSRCRVNDFFC